MAFGQICNELKQWKIDEAKKKFDWTKVKVHRQFFKEIIIKNTEL